ncbi:MAG: Chemotaxis response regulator protein-glutamate methylesterase [Gemmatimonadetes bacterium]|nr:Chemotaxis response regulator protein-glutamate methylesterase [Gemmatimonadota bacterium]
MAEKQRIRVLVVEDSTTARQLLVELLRSDGGFDVVGEAVDGLQAVEAARRLLPDLITMDVNLPGLDGLEATRQIMRAAPTSIVIVSSAMSPSDVDAALTATRAGALMVVPKPTNPMSPDFPRESSEFLAMARAMAAVRVVRRWSGVRAAGPDAVAPARAGGAIVAPRLLAIGTSTGGPAALHRVLSDLPADFPLPIAIVQHMAHGFMPGLANWLANNCGRKVVVGVAGEVVEPGVAYLGPDDHHFSVSASGRITLAGGVPLNGFRPAVDHLFKASAEAFNGAVLAAILTGMGEDGVQGLRTLKQLGGYVIGQDESTSVVFGMARAASIERLTDELLPLDSIGRRLHALATRAQP